MPIRYLFDTRPKTVFLTGGLSLHRVPSGGFARDYARAWDYDQGYFVESFAQVLHSFVYSSIWLWKIPDLFISGITGVPVPKPVQVPTIMFYGRHGSELRCANVACPIFLAYAPTEFGLIPFISPTDLTTGIHQPHYITPLNCVSLSWYAVP